MNSADILNYAITVLVGFTIIFGIVFLAIMIRLVKAVSGLAKQFTLMALTIKTIKSGAQYSIFNLLSKGLALLQSKRG